MNAIRACRLQLCRGNQALLHHLDWVVPEGAWHHLTGPPASGKSTLLHALAALHDEGEGQLEVLGYSLLPIASENALILRRKTGFVDQGGGLLLHKTVRVNLLISLQSSNKLRDQDDDDSILDLLIKFGVEQLVKREVASLSATERWMVAMLRALIRKPRLLLVDNVLDYLGEEMRGRLITGISELVSREKMTVVSTGLHPSSYDLPADRRLKVEGLQLREEV
ncbi:MAG: ATP-binding cassette domain-containing protein [Saprospiraceae bacterium]|nr:ATP-binding cassette domain-containing protein [Saprospiraceae bacterium]